MHVPDGFLDSPTCAVTGAVALFGVTHAVRLLDAESRDDERVPMAALVATFVFAAQMVNFPIGDGISGHLLGGAVAAVLVGPAAAVVCVSGVLVVQALFFADGGVAALGANVTLMALVGTLVGWFAFRAVLAVLPRTPAAVPLAAAAGGLVSVPVAAAAFSGVFALGGRAHVDFGDLFVSMVGWHSLIGVGEGIITGLVVAAVVSVRPDLVRGAARRRLEAVSA